MAPYIPDQRTSQGSFVPTTNIWDIGRLYEVEVGSPEFKELLVRLYQNVNNIAIVLNNKISGYNLNEQVVSGKLYPNPASTDPNKLLPSSFWGFNTGAINAGANPITHNIPLTSTWRLVSIVGGANDSGTPQWYPLPFPGIAGNIEVRVTATQIIITNNSGQTFDSGWLTLEFVPL